jgi:16S rRNA C1402 (ribose-2'-O) methylase RsmI
LTKVYEEVLRRTVSEILNQIAGKKLKGETTLITKGKTPKKKNDREMGW